MVNAFSLRVTFAVVIILLFAVVFVVNVFVFFLVWLFSNEDTGGYGAIGSI